MYGTRAAAAAAAAGSFRTWRPGLDLVDELGLDTPVVCSSRSSGQAAENETAGKAALGRAHLFACTRASSSSSRAAAALPTRRRSAALAAEELRGGGGEERS